ncbi:MAG: ABC transporter permease subunit, partial [Nocardioides sp.]
MTTRVSTSSDDTTVIGPADPVTEEIPPVPDDVDEGDGVDEGAHRAFRPGPVGRIARGAVWALLLWFVLAFPANVLSPFDLGVADVGAATEAVIFAIIALSLNILLGYAGQISLGHQAFVGIGAFTAAYMTTVHEQNFVAAIFVTVLVGATQALLLGFVSLRITGLY